MQESKDAIMKPLSKSQWEVLEHFKKGATGHWYADAYWRSNNKGKYFKIHTVSTDCLIASGHLALVNYVLQLTDKGINHIQINSDAKRAAYVQQLMKEKSMFAAIKRITDAGLTISFTPGPHPESIEMQVTKDRLQVQIVECNTNHLSEDPSRRELEVAEHIDQARQFYLKNTTEKA